MNVQKVKLFADETISEPVEIIQQPEQTVQPVIDLSTAIDPTQDNINLTENHKSLKVCKTSSPSSPSSPARLPDDTTSSPAKNKHKSKASATDDENESEAESKLALRIAEAIRERLCYDDIGGDWYSQKNGLWRVVSEKKALNTIMPALSSAMPYGYSMNKLNNVKAFLTLYLLLDKWTVERNLLPMANGVLNTQTMQLTSYGLEFRFNWQLPYNFNPDAKLDVIKHWLWEASGQDRESINTIRAFFKMALVGGDVQKFLELIGSGGTGKSALIRLLVAFVGKENHVATDLKNLETNNFETAALYGKRLAIISDSSRYGGEVPTLKALTGGDPVRLEKKNKQQASGFVFDGVIVIASNEAIQTADYTSGLIRRRMPVNFNRKVTDEDKQKWAALGGIECVMFKELPALLNWVLAMTDAEVKQAIGGINGQMTQSQRDHLIETNKLAAWIDDNTILDPDAITYIGRSMKKRADYESDMARTEKLYPNYEQWCEDNAVHPVALQRFTSNILDVCQQLKLNVTPKDKDKRGKPIKGLILRLEHHGKHLTPVTKKLLDDLDLVSGDEEVMKQTLDSDDGDEGDDVFLSVTNNKENVVINYDTDTQHKPVSNRLRL